MAWALFAAHLASPSRNRCAGHKIEMVAHPPFSLRPSGSQHEQEQSGSFETDTALPAQISPILIPTLGEKRRERRKEKSCKWMSQRARPPARPSARRMGSTTTRVSLIPNFSDAVPSSLPSGRHQRSVSCRFGRPIMSSFLHHLLHKPARLRELAPPPRPEGCRTRENAVSRNLDFTISPDTVVP